MLKLEECFCQDSSAGHVATVSAVDRKMKDKVKALKRSGYKGNRHAKL